jgi:hypothetical protein
MTGISQNLGAIITAIGALGTAAFGLVDSLKTLPGGGVNRIGFSRIKSAIAALTPGAASNGLTQAKIVDTLKANWFNGTDLPSQKSIAKSLIKVGLNPDNAAALAKQTGVDATKLATVAAKIAAGTALEQDETDVYSRFDFIVTALLDEVYQDADQAYTNGTRLWASAIAVVLALAGGWTLNSGAAHPAPYWFSSNMWVALVAGILATPLAPIAKDLSSALATAVNTLQTIKK